MSYKALLFCPDEATARLVTQVLSDLDFTVELSFEPFVTVKKLSEETFDALVVDCANEQNASVLFKGARSSTLNHNSLCVAVTEGQAGLANAFRIGANLVLTKPINIEQSKNTLRVARGLLRKNAPQSQGRGTPSQSKPAAASAAGPTPAFSGAPAHAPAAPSTPAVPSAPAMASPVAAPSMPSSLLEAEQKRSQPSPGATPTSTPSFASTPRPASAPSFGSTQSSAGFGAAPALAPERADHAHAVSAEPRPLPEIRTAPPLATHDTIFPEATFPERPAPAVPTFSSYAQPSARRSGASKAIWIIPCVLVLGAAGYFGWRKYQPMRFVHLRAAGTSAAAPPVESANQENKPSPSVDVTSEQQSTSSPSSGPSSYATTAPSSSTTSATPTAPAGAEGFATKEHIEITAAPEARERPVTIVAKPPVQSSRKAAPAPVTQEQPAPAPPALVITGTNSSDSTIAGLVTANAALPRAAPTKLRISQGLTQGLVVKRVPPVYPASALQLRREGTVELLATVSKSGSITNVKVLSGDSTLAKAAAEAVKQWKYRPYLLNGEPVEIETQISMIFKLPR